MTRQSRTKSDARWRGPLAGVVTTLLVLGALGMTALRLALPYLSRELPVVEAWASRLVGAPVRIGGIKTYWRNGLPAVALYNIQIRRGHADGPELLRFAHAEAVLDPWLSLRSGQLRAGRLSLDGLRVQLLRRADGRIVVEGFGHQDSHLLGWLLAQSGLQVTGADIALRDARGQLPPLRATGVDFAVIRAGGRRVIDGRAAVVAPLGAALRFALALPTPGSAETPLLRLAASDLDVRRALRAFGQDLPETPRMTASALVEISALAAGGLRAGFDVERLEVGDPAGGLPPARLALAGVLALHAEGLDAQVLRLATDATAGKPRDWRLRVRPGSALPFAVQADHVPLALLQVFDPYLRTLVPSLPALQRAGGALDDLLLGFAAPGAAARHFARGRLVQVDLVGAPSLPSVHGLSAAFTLHDATLALRFEGADFMLADADRLQLPLDVAMLEGSARLARESDGTLRAVLALDGSVNTLPVSLHGRVRLPPAWREGVADLSLGIGTGDITRLATLVPLRVLKTRGDAWLRAAFAGGGTLKSADIAVQGRFADFPFDDGRGRFTLALGIEDTELRYARRWPLAHTVSGAVGIDGRRLVGKLHAARFFSSPLKSATFAMEDVFDPNPYLDVDGVVHAAYGDLMNTLRESPLRAAAAARLADFTLSGAIDLALDLHIGLLPETEDTFLGTVSFDGNALRSARHGLALDDMRGRISFTREEWYGDELTARIGSQRVGLVVNGGIEDSNDDNELRMNGTSTAAQLLELLARHLPRAHDWLAARGKLSVVRGDLAWKALLVTPHVEIGAAQPARQLLIESSLQGLAIDLPWPLGKRANEIRQFRLETTLGGDAREVTRLQFGEALQLAARAVAGRDGESLTLAQLEVVFNADTPPALVQPGIHLHGRLLELPLGEWSALLSEGPALDSGLPVAFDVHVDALHSLGQVFEDVTLQGTRDPLGWRVRIESARVAGDVLVPAAGRSDPVTLDFARLWLRARPRDAGAAAIDPRELPDIALACASFRYEDIDLGRAALATQRAPDGLRLGSLVFHTPAFQVRAEGNWRRQDATHASAFSIQVRGDELGAILQHFGYSADAIRDGRTEIDIEALWPGTPAEFELGRLDGKLSLRVGKGRLLDIEPGGGRLFGLLSLQTLPRRLSLDFADLFQKGYTFDRIEGWFELEKGNAYTNNLLMEGPSSRVEISGRTGLAAHDYDQRALVTPALSRSIPLASAIFGPAGIGVGAAIYLGQQMFKSLPNQVDRILQRHYSITGSWQDPRIEKL